MADRKKILTLALFAVGVSPQVLNGWYNPPLLKYPIAFWAVDVLTLAVLPAVVYLAGLARGIYTNEDLGFRCKFPDRRHLVLFVLACMLMPFVVYYGFLFWMWFGSYLDHALIQRGREDFVFDFSMAVGGEGAIRVLTILYFSLTAGLVEEFYYRGLLKTLFPPGRISMALYVVLSAAVFGLIHWEGGLIKVFAACGLGLILAGAYLITRNLWPLVIGHFAADVVFFS